MHSWIQTHILTELTTNKTRRYSELKPRDVEGNLFMYHLKGIMKEGLVEKHESSYRLSTLGLEHISRKSLKTQKTRDQPQILVTIVARNPEGKYLFYRWNRQPNLDKVSFPHGMLHMGEQLETAALRELKEKVGVELPVHYLGNVVVITPQTHRLVALFEPTTNVDTVSGACFWALKDDVQETDYVDGFYEVANFMSESPKPPIATEIIAQS